MVLQNNNLSVVQNFKANSVADNLAKGRWGNKFKKLYNSLKNEDNKADFTSGMIHCVGTDVLGIVEDLENLRDGLNDFFKLSDNGTAKPNSYFNLLCHSDLVDGTPIIDDIKLSLSLANSSSSDHRKISKFFQHRSSTANSISYLEPIDSYYKREELIDSSNVFYGKVEADSITQKPFYSKNQLSLTVADGTEYGHIEASYLLAPGTNFSNAFDLYGVEEEHLLFLNNFSYESEFSKLFTDLKLEKWLLDFTTYSYSFEKYRPNYYGSISIVFGADLVLAWVNENLASWYAYLNSIDNTRTSREMELISHLNLCATLQEKIGENAGQVSSIWFEFKKKVSPPLIGEGWEAAYDPNYAWWEEEQFDEIRKKVKDFHLFCNFDVGSYDGLEDSGGGVIPTVTLKDEAFDLKGARIYWLVTAFLSIDSRAKKRSFLERLFSFALLVLAIYLTAITANPAWLKMVLIVLTFASYSGALSPEARLIVSAVMLAYGVYDADFSSMTAMELFNWSIENIDLVFNVITDYKSLSNESMGVEEKNEYEKQDKAMRYIYSDSYDCYKVYDNSISVSVELKP